MRLRTTLPRIAVPLALAPCLLWAHAGAAQEASDAAGEYLTMEVATIGMDLHTGAPLALLHAEWERVLPIWIGEVEAQAIARARQGMVVPRPQTHDLFTSVIEAMGGVLEEVRVHDLRDDTFYGALRIRVGNEIREVDSRPSDALALAVRTGATIAVAAHLLETTSDVDFLSAHGERSIVRMRGVTASNPSPGDAQAYGFPEDRAGVFVLHAESALATRGVRKGDLILEVRGEPVGSVLDFLETLGRQPPSAGVPIRLIRDGEEIGVELPAPRPPGRVS
jgi:uncharacterized protein